MKVRIGGLEILDPTWEELDALIDRYGGAVVGTPDENGGQGNQEAQRGSPRKNGGGSSPTDRVVLERLIAAGTAGLPTQDLGEMLGRRGKSIRPGLIEWAQRIGLTKDAGFDPFQEVRVGSRRGARLRDSLQHVAKELLRSL